MSVVDVAVVTKVLNRYEKNESDYKEEFIRLYNAFDTPLLHYEQTSRQFTLSAFLSPLNSRQQSKAQFLYDASVRSSIPAER